MIIKPDFNVDKWCIYNEKKFALELKPNAPIDIRNKFEEWINKYNDCIILEKDADYEAN